MSAFDSLIGNSLIKERLLRLAKKQTLPNSILFSGPEGVGKCLFAKALAIDVLGHEHHPDLHQYYPEGKMGLHSINSMRKFSEEVYIAPYSAQRKIFIIHEADRMWPYGANALLKTFEEPALDAIIILITSAPEMLLPTILSRCFTFRFQTIPEEDIVSLLQTQWHQSPEAAQRLASHSRGSLGKAVMLLQGGGNAIRDMILQLLRKGKISDYCFLCRELEQITSKLEELKKQVEASCREELLLVPAENLTAVQLDNLEKEIDGVASMKIKQDMRTLFEVIGDWYRDMELIRVHADRRYLIHKDYEEDLEQAFQRGELLPLVEVQNILSKSMLSLERNTGIDLCLENLFLQLYTQKT